MPEYSTELARQQAAVQAALPRRGWWNMACWNGLSAPQQWQLIRLGNLPLGYQPQGECQRGATVCIETETDEAPGPRFYCTPCAIEYLQDRG